MYVYSPDIPSCSADLITSRYWNSRFHSLISWGECSTISAVVAANRVPIVPPGTHYCWVGSSGVKNSMFTQGFCTGPAVTDLLKGTTLTMVTLPGQHVMRYRSCIWGMVHTKIHLINKSGPRPNVALQISTRSLSLFI